MMLSQKRNCNRCKCGWYELRSPHFVCTLGFNVEYNNWEGIPQEPCYKPMTYNEVLCARELIANRRQNNE